MNDREIADHLHRVLDRVATEDRLRCVVDGKTTNDGKPAPLCPSIVSHPEQMCAGCAARQALYTTGIALQQAAGYPRVDSRA